jgi:PRTRC genetic system protein A
MFKNIVTYHIHHHGSLPPNDAQGYQYILAAAGVYLRAENRFFDVLLPIARCPIRGLTPLQPHFRLKVPRLPVRLLNAVLSDARRARCRNGGLKEALYHFHHDGARLRVLKPPQRATAASVVGAEGNSARVILDLHSHGSMPAFWSTTDDRDEQGFRVYGVMGRLDTAPEIRLRLGVHGYWFPLAVRLLFDGPGELVDVNARKMRRGAKHADA